MGDDIEGLSTDGTRGAEEGDCFHNSFLIISCSSYYTVLWDQLVKWDGEVRGMGVFYVGVFANALTG